MLRFSYKKCCSPTVLAYQSHRNFVVSLSRLFLLGFAFFSSLCLLFKRSFRNSSPKSKIDPRESRCFAGFAVLTVFSVFFAPDWKKPNVSCETFGFFLLSCFLPLFFSVFSSLFQPVLFRFFLPLRSSRCFSLLFALFLGRFFAFCASRVIFRGVFLFFFRFSCFFLVSGALPSLFRCAFGVVSAFCVLRVILRCAFLLWVHFLRISGSFWARFS